MSAIGDYIHFSRQNYLAHGTTQDGNFEMWKSAVEDVKKRVAKSAVTISDGDSEKIAQALEGILKSNIKDDSAEAQAKREIERILTEKYQDALQNVDYSTGNVTTKDKNSVIGQARSSTNITNLLTRANRLEEIISSKASKGAINAKEALVQVQELQKFYDHMATEINRYKKRNKIQITEDPRLHKDLQAKKASLNKLIKEFAAFPATELQKGDFFEIAVAQLSEVCENVIASVIKGELREKVEYNRAAFEEKYLTKNFGDMLEKTSVSQGKVDVEIWWKGQDQISQLLEASIKNADFSRYYIHVLSGSSLLFMIQDLDTDFVNHFLNLFAKHKGKDSNDFMNLKQQMAEEMRLVLLYKGLTGDNYQRESANLFIVNDNNTGKVRVYKMQDLVDRAVENIKVLKGIQINGKTLNEKISFVNNWSETPDIRISSLLAQVQAAKVSASIFTGLL